MYFSNMWFHVKLLWPFAKAGFTVAVHCCFGANSGNLELLVSMMNKFKEEGSSPAASAHEGSSLQVQNFDCHFLTTVHFWCISQTLTQK